MAKTSDERCARQSYKIWPPTQCKRPGTVEEEGKLWCWQHAPSAAKRRYEETIARYDEKLAERRKFEMRRAWDLVVGKLRRMDPKLAREVERMAAKDEQL